MNALTLLALAALAAGVGAWTLRLGFGACERIVAETLEDMERP